MSDRAADFGSRPTCPTHGATARDDGTCMVRNCRYGQRLRVDLAADVSQAVEALETAKAQTDVLALAQAMQDDWLNGVIFDPSPSGPPKINWQLWAERILTRVTPPADMCHNGHPFEPGVSEDAPDERDTRWCNTCGATRVPSPGQEA